MLPFTGTVKMKRNLSAGAEKHGKSQAEPKVCLGFPRLFCGELYTFFGFSLQKEKGYLSVETWENLSKILIIYLSSKDK